MAIELRTLKIYELTTTNLLNFCNIDKYTKKNKKAPNHQESNLKQHTTNSQKQPV